VNQVKAVLTFMIQVEAEHKANQAAWGRARGQRKFENQ